MAADKAHRPHLLIIPFPAQGHLIPLLDFTRKLASDDHAPSITIFTTSNNLTLLQPLLASRPSIDTLVLPFPPHPRIPPGIEHVRELPNSTPLFMSALSSLHHPIAQWFHSHPSPPDFIISDMFCGWTHPLAAELGIRRIVFSPSGAFALCLMLTIWKERPMPQNENYANDVVSFTTIPNCPKYPWWQLSPLYRSYLNKQPGSEFLKDEFANNMASWGLAINSFSELEGVYLEHLKNILGHDRVWPVGPLGPNDSEAIQKRGGSHSNVSDEVTSWLDKRHDNNVVYVCFGSQTSLTKEQTTQIALGLEKSGVHFVWSLKVRDDEQWIPSGFEDRVADRGLVLNNWAPQVLILGHRAVGAFLTHCGWNSVMESIVAGVPTLTWPMGADQFSDATLLEEELEVGERVAEGADAVPDSDVLARAFAASVSENGEERRLRAMKLREHAIHAMKGVESSIKELQSLMEEKKK